MGEAFGLEIETDERLIEPHNRFEGKKFEFGLQVLTKPVSWPWVLNPFRPSWGEAYASIATRMLAAIDDAWRTTEDGDAVLVSHQLPICMVQRSLEGRHLFHDPRNRRCSLSSITTARQRRRVRPGGLPGSGSSDVRAGPRPGSRVKITLKAGALALAAALLLSGCSSDPLAEQYRDGGNQNYIAGDGTVLEIPEANRDAPIEFTSTTDSGKKVSAEDYRGGVLVVNFWAAYCDPCRVEAPDLEKLSRAYDGKGAAFLGVNIADTADTSLAFARKYQVTYPSALDANSGSVRLAFAGKTAQSALPTTLVLDAQGRVAARILGQLQSASILDTIIKSVLSEKTTAQ